MATPPYTSKDRLRESNEPYKWEMVAKQKSAEELQGPGAGGASSNNVPQTSLHQATMEVISQHANKLRKRNFDEGQTSSVRHDIMMEKLVKYLKLTKVCMEGIQKICSPKFNNEQCGYLVEKLEATLESARLFIEEYQAQSSEMFSILNMERWVETFKFLLVLGKQVEGFVQDCGKDEWIQVAVTLSNVGEYVSSIGFNLELCKVALCKWEGVIKYYTLEEVVKLNAYEVESVKKKALDDTHTLLKKVMEVFNTLNAQDVELVKYLKLKLAGDMGKPSFVEDNSNVFLKLFNWVKNMGERVEQIGAGTSAKVYKVKWFGIPVAKKTFDGPENPVFLQEAKVLSQLHHPNITSLFCCNINRRECSIIMELMDGSLYDLLQSRQGEDDKFIPFSDVEDLNLMLQIGEGVEYLHRNKIAHRDLKSANILVKRLEASNLEVVYTQLKVVDFGLSKIKEASISLSPVTYNVGSSRWMAPEIIKFFNVEDVLRSPEKLPKYNFKGDIYSFGMVCYEILVGEIPFQSVVHDRNVKKMVLRGLRPSLPKYCPPRLAELIQQCWSHDPKDRPSIGDICAKLKYLKYLLLMRTRDENVQIKAIDDNVEIEAIDDNVEIEAVDNQEAQADAWALVSDDSFNYESYPAILKSRLLEASMKECQLVSEKRILERHVAELRLAYDQQQHRLLDATSKALSYRQDVLEENIRLTNALQVAEQERATYVQNLMPLLAEFDLQPPVSDAHSMVSHIKILEQRLRSELELYESKMKGPQYYQQSYQPPYQQSQSYDPPPQSPTFHQLLQFSSCEQEDQVGTRAFLLHIMVPGREILMRTLPAPMSKRLQQMQGRLCVMIQLSRGQMKALMIRRAMIFLTMEQVRVKLRLLADLMSIGQHLRRCRPYLKNLILPAMKIYSDPLPGTVGLCIVGDAVLGGRLTACGHSINGTPLCVFQVRHYQDGTAAMIEGAEQPEYSITADDIECVVAVECVPINERGRRGDLVTVMANDGYWISRDPMIQDQINNYMKNGQATFDVSLLIQERTSEDVSEPATLVLRRSNLELKRNNGRKVTINEKYTPEILMKKPCGELLRCVISKEDSSKKHFLELRDPRTRDMAVLTFRAFHNAAMDELKEETKQMA